MNHAISAQNFFGAKFVLKKNSKFSQIFVLFFGILLFSLLFTQFQTEIVDQICEEQIKSFSFATICGVSRLKDKNYEGKTRIATL